MQFSLKKETLAILIFLSFSFLTPGISKQTKGEASRQSYGESMILIDNWGVPHIYAKNERDLYYATGFVHARDRLFQMDMFRRIASGCLSEVLGLGSYSSDVYYRRLGLYESAEATYNFLKSDPSSKPFIEALDAYCEGVNSFISQTSSENLPVEFKLLLYTPEPWKPVDSLVWGKLMEWNLAGQTYDLLIGLATNQFGEDIVEELFPLNNTYGIIPVLPNFGNYTNTSTYTTTFSTTENPKNLDQLTETYQNILNSIPTELDIFPGKTWKLSDIGLTGSNNWVVGGNLTQSGYPLLSNDMHLSWTLPPIWYEIHQVILESDFNVYGFSFPGVPLIIAGHNTKAAWGYTNVGADVCDYYYYKTNPANSNEYWNDTSKSWQAFETKTEIIKIKGENPRNETVVKTNHGPIISSFRPEGVSEDLPVALRWTGNDVPDELLKAVYYINRAHNLTAIKEAQKFWGVPAQNFAFADVHGNIAMRPVGKYPIRNTSAGYWGRVPYNGSANENPWLGYIPYEELSVAENPFQGYFASVNQKTAGPQYSHVLGSFFAPGYRARRINELLRALDDDNLATLKIMQDFQSDNIDTAAQSFLPSFLSIPANTTKRQEALTIISQWNASMLKDLVAPTIWHWWMEIFIDLTFHDEYEAMNATGLPYPQWNNFEYFVQNNESISWFDDVETIDINETVDHIVAIALDETLDSLEAFFATSNMSEWLWGTYHQMQIDHLAGDILESWNRGPFPWDGSENTLNAAGGPIVRGGPSERIVYDLARLVNNSAYAAYSVLPGGQSGNVSNPHYDDQLTLFRSYQYHPAWFYDNPEDFPSSEIEYSTILKPKPQTKSSGTISFVEYIILITLILFGRKKFNKRTRN